MNKKAFTLIEVILALLIASFASIYIIKQMGQSSFNKDVRLLQKTIKMIINDGIISKNGYASRLGTQAAAGVDDLVSTGSCSPDFDFNSLTTKRLATCMDWVEIAYPSPGVYATSSKRFKLSSTASGVLYGSGLMENYGNCYFETKVVTGNTRQFDVFLDCSDVEYSDRSKEYLEDAIKFVFEKELSNIYIDTDENATSLTGTFLGDDEDGQIRARFEL